MVLKIFIELTDIEILQMAISLSGTLFTMSSLIVNYLMLKEMKR